MLLSQYNEYYFTLLCIGILLQSHILPCSFGRILVFRNPMSRHMTSQITKFMGPTWGPPGSCRPQMGPMYLVIRDHIMHEWTHHGCHRTVQEGHNSIHNYTAIALELHLSCTNPANMPECPCTESGLKRCCWHRFNSDSVPAHSVMFIGKLSIGVWKLQLHLSGPKSWCDTSWVTHSPTLGKNMCPFCYLHGKCSFWLI